MVSKHPLQHDQPDRAPPDAAGPFIPLSERDFAMVNNPQILAFEADASETLLSMLQKATLCTDMLPDELVEIAALKFLALRALSRARRGEPTVLPRTAFASMSVGLRAAAPEMTPPGGPSRKRVGHGRFDR